MSTLGAAFKADGEALQQNVGYRLEGFYLDIIDNIAAAMGRAEPPMNKSDLAKAMHVSPARVTNLMRGYKPNLELKTIVQVAMALRLEPNDLCARRKTPEMLSKPLRAMPAPAEYRNAVIAEETNGKKQVA